MLELKDLFKQYITSYCEQVYSSMRNEYPTFMVDSEVINATEAALTAYYLDVMAQVDAAAPEDLATLGADLLTSAATMTMSVTAGHHQVQMQLLNELNEMGKVLSTLGSP